MKICHLTSVHKSNDVRIFLKECSSLAKYHETFYLVVNGKDETKNNVKIIGVKVNYNNRLQRFTKAVNTLLQKAIEIDADVYHIHDPELLRIAVKLKSKKKAVIYDAHEDLPRQILSKPYLNPKVTKLISFLIEKYENRVSRKLDAIVTATPFIKDRFLKINKNTFNINNYPLDEELDLEFKGEKPTNHICYIGGITQIRGIEQLIDALEYTQGIKLYIAGEFSSKEFEFKLKKKKGWKKTIELGFISREKAKEIKSKCFAGIVTFLPEQNHINAQPNKIFEYMASGLCVIGSNFKLWKQIIEDNNVGLCVDPNNPKEIGKAINYLKENPEEVVKMSENGLKSVQNIFNWSSEEKKLIKLYENL
jgi:glycosyltransferase involved in cell wall biosynthesis